MKSGKVSATDVAKIAFNAIAAGQFYIFSHPGALRNVTTRMDAIVSLRNPSDPYATTAHVRDLLRAKMKGK